MKASNTGAGDGFGLSVTLSGNSLAVGAYGEDGDGIGGRSSKWWVIGNSGAVYVFTRSGSTWSQQAFIKASNTGSVDQFGWKVSLDGDLLIVAAADQYLSSTVEGEDSLAIGINGNQSDDSASGSGAGLRIPSCRDDLEPAGLCEGLQYR